MYKVVAAIAMGVVLLAVGATYLWVRPPAQDQGDVATLPGDRARQGKQPGPFEGPTRLGSAVLASRGPHPLLKDADDAVLSFNTEAVASTADARLVEVMQAVKEPRNTTEALAALAIDYPLDQSVFPPEMVAPTFLWHDSAEGADTWLFDLSLAGGSEHIYVLAPGRHPPVSPIDERCVAKTNEIYRGTPYQASARAWKPGDAVWNATKQRSVAQPARVTIYGFSSEDPAKVLSRGRVTIATSKDPVGAPIFYRDVPLAPSDTEEGVIKPLSEAHLPLIEWRLRDVAKAESRLLVTDLLTCTNCHSFSADGKTLGMDLDGPSGDKGEYVIVPVDKETVIEQKHVMSWNSYLGKPQDRNIIGFLSRMSPDGRYVVTTLNESVYVQNFTDYRFLQVFYPTRGILGYYRRSENQVKALPGADDPKYVHCDAVWSPDGKSLVFARAEARDAYPKGYRPATHPNDPAETQIQYDLYRMPFDDGRGGKPEPISGASQNGMSNSFPKVSPDGRWIVFVQCRNGQLLRPDSQLWIVPAAGGEARRMRCNTSRMNSWHSFSPNGRWLVFSSKANTPYTQMFLTHLDEEGRDSPAVLIPDSTASNRAVNLPEFVNIAYDDLVSIRVPAVEYRNDGMRGIRLFEQGKLDDAMVEFETAVRKRPDYLEGHVSVAVILIEKGRLDEAVSRLEKALALDPKCWFAHANLGLIRERQGKPAEAIAHFTKAVEINPKHVVTRANLGRALAGQGTLGEATVHFRAAVKLAPRDAGNRLNLGNVLLDRGALTEAVEQYEAAVQINPRLVSARLGLGEALTQRGQFDQAIAQFRTAREIAPNDPNAANSLAWLLATCPEVRLRDGAEAVALSQQACQGTQNKDPLCLRTLAAAYAEAGKWPEAMATAMRALSLARSQRSPLAREIQEQLELNRQRKPVRLPIDMPD